MITNRQDVYASLMAGMYDSDYCWAECCIILDCRSIASSQLLYITFDACAMMPHNHAIIDAGQPSHGKQHVHDQLRWYLVLQLVGV